MKQYHDQIVESLGTVEQWHHNCHAASITIVKDEIIPGARVARGFCVGVGSQHSWVAVGDPYDPDTPIVDPTLWSYRDDVDDIWYGTRERGWHHPHGSGSIWEAGRPPYPEDEPFDLAEVVGHTWSPKTQRFIELLGPLDEEGWCVLAHLPVEGWPASEIHTVMQCHHKTRWAPIDIVGMVTDLNPGGLYLPGDEIEVMSGV